MHMYQSIKDPNKDDREEYQKFLLANPDKAADLTNSALGDNPQLLQQFSQFGNARFGGNSNAGTNLAQSISNAPLSDVNRAQKLESLSNNVNLNDVANASKQLPEMRAYNGVSNSDFANKAGDIANKIGKGDSGLVSDTDKDILAKSRGLPTAAEQKESTSRLKLLDQETANQIAMGDRYKAELPGVQASSDNAVRNNNVQQAADDAVEAYFKSHPEARSKKLTDIFLDKTVDQDVRVALPMSSKYGDAFKTQLSQDAEKERLQLQKEALNNEHLDRNDWYPKMIQANAMEMFGKYGGESGIKGYVDMLSGNNTPEAQTARATLSGGTPAQKAAKASEYTKSLNQLQTLLSKGKMSTDAIQASVDELNAQAQILTAMGIDKPQITYGESKHKNVAEKMSDMIPFTNKTMSLQTVDGGIPTGAVYDPGKDPSKLKTQVKNKSQEDELQEKGEMFADIKAKNPSLPDQAIIARVDAEYNKKNKKP